MSVITGSLRLTLDFKMTLLLLDCGSWGHVDVFGSVFFVCFFFADQFVLVEL